MLLVSVVGGGFGDGDGDGAGDYGAVGEGGLVEFAVAAPVQDEPFQNGAEEEVPGPVEPEPQPLPEAQPIAVAARLAPASEVDVGVDVEVDVEPEADAPVVEGDGTMPVAAAPPEDSDGDATQEAATEPGQALATPAAGTQAASGTGAQTTDMGRPAGERGIGDLILRSAGLIPGSVAQQRSLLPGAAHCDDPVVGVWRAHKYSPQFRDWAHFTLRVRRADSDRLEGTITTRLWNGTRFDSTPPPCGPDLYDYTVQMNARGMARGQSITFGSRAYRVLRATCPRPFGLTYNPDRFSGTIDPDRQEFQSVNNDGGRDINAPYLFRRIDCDPEG